MTLLVLLNAVGPQEQSQQRAHHHNDVDRGSRSRACAEKAPNQAAVSVVMSVPSTESTSALST